MNDQRQRLDSGMTYERQPQMVEQLRSGSEPAVTYLRVSNRPSRDLSLRRIAVVTILAFWTLQYFAVTGIWLLRDPESEQVFLLPRAAVVGGNALLSFGFLVVLDRMRFYSLAVRALVAAIFVIIAPAFAGALNWMAFNYLPPRPSAERTTIAILADNYLYFLWVFGSLAAILVALSYATVVRDQEKRIGALHSLAHSAQMRALRYQLNPHLLFNALNSIVGLLSSNRGREAETMTTNLGDFLRSTLALDPQKFITLGDEIQLQELYLDIEKVRFPDRLNVRIDVPDEFRTALVPSLITQPLIENSIKYAVARSTEPVRLTIQAVLHGERLDVTIEDSGGDAQGLPPKSTTVGLLNTSERLRVHYGDAARFEAGPKVGGGFRNVISIPFQRKA